MDSLCFNRHHRLISGLVDAARLRFVEPNEAGLRLFPHSEIETDCCGCLEEGTALAIAATDACLVHGQKELARHHAKKALALLASYRPYRRSGGI